MNASLQHAPQPLDRLESDLMTRIAAHRRARSASGTLSVGVFVTLTALVVGVIMGLMQPPPGAGAHGSETVVLADDARLAPSNLLIHNP